MMTFEDAIRATKEGAVIDFEVTPGAKSAEVPSGYNQWRKRIEARIRAQPEKASGATNSRKSVLVRGISAADAAKVLGGKLGG
jgi:uncharacterized protein YggU (UPF0235/DUF167 family)